ncbi:carbonic anhydrase [Piscinibacterium candidicorallinum]|uniref:carbonic anhydrase n=1 Tax=Piscinibacterium candidicorallinum TaxID=1793872 RepID=A0ABV7H7Y2_9BURK
MRIAPLPFHAVTSCAVFVRRLLAVTLLAAAGSAQAIVTPDVPEAQKVPVTNPNAPKSPQDNNPQRRHNIETPALANRRREASLPKPGTEGGELTLAALQELLKDGKAPRTGELTLSAASAAPANSGAAAPRSAARGAPARGAVSPATQVAGKSADQAVHWSYADDETGPAHWGRLDPRFNVCAIGKRQSPIDIQDSEALQIPMEPIQFKWGKAQGSVVHTGHTLQVDVEAGHSIHIRGKDFRLLQFHFHLPSEHRVNGRGYPMVAHFVHKADDGQLAVVALLMDRGEVNPQIARVWSSIPLDKGDRVRLPADGVDLAALLPADQRYYQFIGSLTTPPCTEGVVWNVLKTPATLSAQQIETFARIFPMNARPVQPGNGRIVKSAQ